MAVEQDNRENRASGDTKESGDPFLHGKLRRKGAEMRIRSDGGIGCQPVISPRQTGSLSHGRNIPRYHHGGDVGRIEKYSMSSSWPSTRARTNSRSWSISTLVKTFRSLVTNCPCFTWPFSIFNFSTSSLGASRL